ncbi:MAG: 4'-phosphopantetheinyl transferase superfamily protein [Roseburia sp.]|nr:4'-phosphopantetheinyl transferase superfamily protein [Roseburia sp.]MCM1278952.1 4'-phosphopantetheinyl transferase superfamily protein [Robinsoniella sp.]
MKIFVLNVEQLNQAEIFQRAYDTVDAFRKEKVDRCKRQPDKNRSLGAGLLLSYGILKGLNIPWQELKEQCGMNCGKYGKPYFQEWKGISFNLSHSGSYAACVVSGMETPHDFHEEMEVGIDIQKLRPCDLRVASKVFSKEDYEGLEKVWLRDKGQGDLLFTRLWTEMESRGKLLGTGIFLPKEADARLYEKEYMVGKEYWISVAAKRDEFPDGICKLTVEEALNALEYEAERKENI